MGRLAKTAAGLLVVIASVAACGPGEDGSSSPPLLDTAHDVPVPAAMRGGAEPNWISRPTTLGEAAQKADAGGIVTVEAVAPGEPLVAADDEVNPTVVVTMRVRDLWFGSLEPTITMKWLGTPGHGHMEGDPPYEPGQDYVIMLKKRGDGPWFRPESPDGRIQIHRDRARPVIEGPIADTVRGWGVGRLEQAVREATAGA